jgi:hypothetical protein
VRLAWLFLQSRLAGRALIAVVGIAGLTWLCAWRWPAEIPLRLTLVMAPLAAATVIAVTVGSPWGDAERAASYPLFRLRFGHVLGLLGVAACAAGLVAADRFPADAEWAVARNIVGLGGLGLLTARVAGAGLAWLGPVVVGVSALVLAPGARLSDWNWPVKPGDDARSLGVALLLGALGLAVVSARGARESAE